MLKVVKFCRGRRYLPGFKVSAHEILTNYTVKQTARYHLNQVSSQQMPVMMPHDENTIHLCDIPAKKAWPKSNHEETSNKNPNWEAVDCAFKYCSGCDQ